MIIQKMTPHRWALLIVALVAGILLCRGVELLFIPSIYKLAQMHNPFLYYEGYILIAMSVTVAFFHRWAARKLVWAAQEIHRWVSALLMVGVVSVDATMHVFNIPHMEGWWLPLFGGGAAVSVMGSWIQKLRRKPAATDFE